MILVDTSVWIDHLHRSGAPAILPLLEAGEVVTHPFVIGELACGDLRNRERVLRLMAALPVSAVATDSEAMALIERHRLMGRGLGWIDVHLLASALLSGTRIWSRDKHLAGTAEKLNVRFDG